MSMSVITLATIAIAMATGLASGLRSAFS